MTRDCFGVASGVDEDQRLLSVVRHLELELGHLKSELSDWQHLKTSCGRLDKIHEKASFLHLSFILKSKEETLDLMSPFYIFNSNFL